MFFFSFLFLAFLLIFGSGSDFSFFFYFERERQQESDGALVQGFFDDEWILLVDLLEIPHEGAFRMARYTLAYSVCCVIPG